MGPSGSSLLILLIAASLAGCARESQDVRGVRLAVERYFDLLERNDLTGLRARSTCVMPYQSIVGGIVLRVDPIRLTTPAALDSLVRAAASRHRTHDSLFARSSESAADSLFLRSRLYARRHVLYRNAIRAARLSVDGEDLAPDAAIRATRVRVRIRYAGPLVGPKPVDREHIVRALAAPGGRWIVFSANAREDDPRPEPI